MIQLTRTALLVLLFVAVALGITLVAAGTLLGIPSADLPAVTMLFAQVGSGVGLLALVGMQPIVLQRIGGVGFVAIKWAGHKSPSKVGGKQAD